MKATLIWIASCLIIGVGGGLYYLNRPAAVEARNETTLVNSTPKPNAPLVSKHFTNDGHKYTLQFFSDALVTNGKLATAAGQQAILARPGSTATSYVVLASPIGNDHDNERSDCASRTGNKAAFSVNLYGGAVSVCSNATSNIYMMDVRATGTWEEVVMFNAAQTSMANVNDQLKTIFASVSIE